MDARELSNHSFSVLKEHSLVDTMSSLSGLGFLGQVGQAQAEIFAATDAVNSQVSTYAEFNTAMSSLLPALDDLEKVYKDFAKVINTEITKQAGAHIMNPLSFVFIAAKVIQDLSAANKAPTAAKEAVKAIASVVREIDSSFYAYQSITVEHLVARGILTESQASKFGSSVGIADIKSTPLTRAMSLWASKFNASEAPLNAQRTLFWSKFGELRAKTQALINLIGPKDLQLTDLNRVKEIQLIILDELEKANKEVKSGVTDTGWVELLFNKIVSFVVSDPVGAALYLFGGVLNPITHTLRPITLNLKVPSFAAIQLINASAEAAKAGVIAGAITFKKARIDNKLSEAEATALANKAIKDTTATVATKEYEDAYKRIIQYQEYYSKMIADALAGFGKGLSLGLEKLAKYLMIGAGVVATAVIVSKV